MKHPFQRKTSKKSPEASPFQMELVRALEAYTDGNKRMSGRQLSLILGKSANHISQMLNDGLVPSGQTILEMAEVLELDQGGTDRLIRSAMETKAAQRSRDNFWINQTSRMLRSADDELASCQAFIAEAGLSSAFEQFNERRHRAPDPTEDLD